MKIHGALAGLVLVGFTIACAVPDGETPDPAPPGRPRIEYAIAIHGGAGAIPDAPETELQAYRDGLTVAIEAGLAVLKDSGDSLDAVQLVVRTLEDDPLFNAGRGAVFNHDGGHELDASIMDGGTHACGAVTGVTSVRNPVVLARAVMDRTKHVLMAGAGAERFADEVGVQRVEPTWFDTERRKESWKRYHEKRTEGGGDGPRGTVGAVAIDRHGNLAAATSTGGLTGKRFGRVGDTPIVGAGTWADNDTCAVSGTGRGEEFIRHAVAHRVDALVRYGALDLQEAVDRVIHGVLQPGDGGVIAVGRDGQVAFAFSTPGMYRAVADSTGRFEVAIGR